MSNKVGFYGQVMTFLPVMDNWTTTAGRNIRLLFWSDWWAWLLLQSQNNSRIKNFRVIHLPLASKTFTTLARPSVQLYTLFLQTEVFQWDVWKHSFIAFSLCSATFTLGVFFAPFCFNSSISASSANFNSQNEFFAENCKFLYLFIFFLLQRVGLVALGLWCAEHHQRNWWNVKWFTHLLRR